MQSLEEDDLGQISESIQFPKIKSIIGDSINNFLKYYKERLDFYRKLSKEKNKATAINWNKWKKEDKKLAAREKEIAISAAGNYVILIGYAKTLAENHPIRKFAEGIFIPLRALRRLNEIVERIGISMVDPIEIPILPLERITPTP